MVIQVILIFDVSLRKAAGTAKSAIQETGSRMNDALRERVRTLRERAAQETVPADAHFSAPDSAEAVEPEYDHRIDESPPDISVWIPESAEPDETAGETVEEVRPPRKRKPEDLRGTPPGEPEPESGPDGGEDAGEGSGEPTVLPAGIVHIGLPSKKTGRKASGKAGADLATGGDAEDAEDVTAGPDASPPVPYTPPPSTLLQPGRASNAVANAITVNSLGRKLEETLASFGIAAKVSNITSGPSITRFELIPGPGIKVSRIVSLSDDIALSLAAVGVRIEAPIPGKSAIGVEIPNKETAPVALRGLIESQEYRQFPSRLSAVLGRDIAGQPILCDITRMPHLMIAGATGSGKSVCINALLMSVLFRAHPDEVKLILIDPKVVELSMYNGIPHLLVPVVTDPKKASFALIWAVNEMNNRYRKFSERAVRDITAYNAAAPDEGYDPMPLILIVIDELADLMATSPTEVEDAIARLTAMARAAGIHLVIATQRPSVDVITGVIKANIPSRIAFAVASQVDSRTILDMAGAEKLLGKGDMLYFPQSSPKPIRGQGAMVTDAEVETVIAYLKAQNREGYDTATAEAIVATPVAGTGRETQDADELLPAAVEIVIEAGYASVSLLQRRMNVGYPRAARLIDRMQEAGYVGPFEGSKPRKVIITRQRWMEIQSAGNEDS
ncbi:MAG: DNA translocase FtsK [Clostridia bacterium]|nr:DNA translocase FtsK [Clostridia bacterium]